jgi:hypothetical protein
MCCYKYGFLLSSSTAQTVLLAASRCRTKGDDKVTILLPLEDVGGSVVSTQVSRMAGMFLVQETIISPEEVHTIAASRTAEDMYSFSRYMLPPRSVLQQF